jgi:hypothetical protein
VAARIPSARTGSIEVRPVVVFGPPTEAEALPGHHAAGAPTAAT